MRSENCWKRGIISSTPTLSCLKMFGESGATFEEPPNIVSAIPPLAFSS